MIPSRNTCLWHCRSGRPTIIWNSRPFCFERENRAEIKDYRQVSKEEVMAAGFDPVYPFVGKDSPAGKKLTACIENDGTGQDERNFIGTLVCLNA